VETDSIDEVSIVSIANTKLFKGELRKVSYLKGGYHGSGK